MRKLTVAAATAALAAMAVIGSTSSAGAAPRIWGGGRVDAAPWAVQLYLDNTTTLNGFICSATIIAPQWVLSARHCLNVVPAPMHVKVGDVALGQGTESEVDQQLFPPNADLALVHLSTPVTAAYMKLADSEPAVGSIDQIYGWGFTEDPAPPGQKVLSPYLKTADVQVLGQGTDAYSGVSVQSVGVTGSVRPGDSGGPELAGGVQVGVCSTERVKVGDPIHEVDNYASVVAHRDWIRQTAGV